MFLVQKIKQWLTAQDWEQDGDIVTQCPICRKWIENGNGMENWFRHLLDRHRHWNLRKHSFDVELLQYLVGENPEYGKEG